MSKTETYKKDSIIVKEGGLAYAYSIAGGKPLLMTKEEAEYWPCGYFKLCPVVSDSENEITYDVSEAA